MGPYADKNRLACPADLNPCMPLLALARRPIQVLTPVITIATLAMLHPRQDLPLRSPITLQCIRDNDTWHVWTPCEQLAKALLCGPRVPPTLREDIENWVPIHGGM